MSRFFCKNSIVNCSIDVLLYMKKYVYKPYEQTYPEMFRREKNRLDKLLPNNYVIEHIGSTAVPGLGGKGIIDIYITVSQDQLSQVKQELESVGYIHIPEVGEGERLYFRIDLPDKLEKIRRYHVHISEHGNKDFLQAVAFRNYLRENKDAKVEYIAIKQQAVKEAAGDKEIYMRIKKPFIRKVLNKTIEGRK